MVVNGGKRVTTVRWWVYRLLSLDINILVKLKNHFDSNLITPYANIMAFAILGQTAPRAICLVPYN